MIPEDIYSGPAFLISRANPLGEEPYIRIEVVESKLIEEGVNPDGSRFERGNTRWLYKGQMSLVEAENLGVNLVLGIGDDFKKIYKKHLDVATRIKLGYEFIDQVKEAKQIDFEVKQGETKYHNVSFNVTVVD